MKKVCPCCDSETWEEAFSMTEQSFDGIASVSVTYYTCSACGYTYKDPLPAGLDTYYGSNWQSPSRPHDDEAAWVTETLRAHGRYRLESVYDAGARTEDLVDAIGEHATIGTRGVSDPNTGGAFLGTPEFRATHQYELVCFTHVLEHVTDIHAVMGDLESLSSDFIFLEVPSPELGSVNPTNDDIARTHLHHYTLTSLIKLALKRGLTILRADFGVGDRLQSNRLLLKKGPPDGVRIIRGVKTNLDHAYTLALSTFVEGDPATTGLYGKSDAYFKFTQLDDRVAAFPVFDKYRGSLDGIEHMESVVITPRQPQVREAIKADLDKAGVPWLDAWRNDHWQ